ncbi:MAG TPA: hypothetical protein VI942_06875 [Thermoanaerobaculia bacterium]|nr:hypothetical protein [Thermoanaerobaculia bacterium]
MSDDLRASRVRFEHSLRELSDAAGRELGWAPKLSRWLLPLVAGAVGLAIGVAVRRNLPRLRDRA